jgi:hypothetical protein
MALNFTSPRQAFSTRPVKVMLKHFVVLLLLAPGALVWGALDEAFVEATFNELEADSTRSLNGLEADSTTSLNVMIELLSKEEEKIGLTSERIEARVNQSLRKAGITPVSGGGLREDNLYVNVNVSASGCFAISIEFNRPVFYHSRGKWFTMTARTTWSSSGTGIARRRGLHTRPHRTKDRGVLQRISKSQREIADHHDGYGFGSIELGTLQGRDERSKAYHYSDNQSRIRIRRWLRTKQEPLGVFQRGVPLARRNAVPITKPPL